MTTKRSLATIVGLLAGGVVAATAANGQSSARQLRWPPAGVSFHGDRGAPDISGLWLGSVTGERGVAFEPNRGPMDERPPVYFSPWPLPYTPAYQKIFDDRRTAAKGGRALGDISARCLPFGLPQMLVSKFYPDEIVQTPGQVTFFMNSTFPIVIWTDGRGHPANLQPSYNGHSIGHWEGDTLHVDTVGIKGTTALSSQRWPHSDKLHIMWTVGRVGPDTLRVNLTFEDKDAFTAPVTETNMWARKTDPRWQVLDDSSCFENNLETTGESGEPGFPKF